MTSTEFINSEKNKPRLVVGGYIFYKDFMNDAKTYWRCIHYKTLNCKARVHTVNNTIFKEIRSHNHAANAAKSSTDILINKMKATAKESDRSPHLITATLYAEAPTSIAAQLPTNSSLKRTIRRVRQQGANYPKNPLFIEELVVPDNFKFSDKGEEFLLYDSADNKNRMFVFTTKRNLLLLSQNSEWYSDGTFKTCPSLFKQLYTIHIIKNNKSIPLVYALLPNKTQITYIHLLEKLKQLEPTLKPTNILTDLERAAINAFQHVFPDISVQVCHFHFKQCIYRQLQAIGLKSAYDLDPQFSKLIRMIAALAYAKETDVEQYFIKLASIMPNNCEDFLDYFGKQFIGYADIRGVKKEGQFPIRMWNIYNKAQLPKTNNHIEGWHRGFAELIHQNHPSIWKFINMLKLEQSKNEIILQQFLSQCDAGLPTKKRYLDQWDRISKIVLSYNNMDSLEFLEAIALNIIF